MSRHERKGRQSTPPSIPKGPRRLEVTRFLGSKLQQVDADITTHLTSIPDQSRDQAVKALNLKPKEADRMQNALDVLNQLAVLDRTGADVRSVVVFQMLDTDLVAAGRHAEGSRHYDYDIDWVNPPTEKPSPQPNTQQPTDQGPQRKSESFISTRRQERAERRRRREQDEELVRRRQERTALDKLIIDSTAETAQRSLEAGQVIIGTSEDGEGVILFSEFGFGNHKEVDRKDCSYPEWGNYRKYLRPEYFRFYEDIAQEIDGNEPQEYIPIPLPPKVCIETYDKAIGAKMLKATGTPDNGVQFEYAQDPSSPFFDMFQILEPRFVSMDLVNRTVLADDYLTGGLRSRPIHPDFAEFLKQKKIEQDAKQ